jgi:hypothetical protein
VRATPVRSRGPTIRPAPFVSKRPDRFLVRATGGLVFSGVGAETDARLPRGYFNVVSGDSGLGSRRRP